MTFHSPKDAVLVATGEKTGETVDGNTRVTTWKSPIKGNVKRNASPSARCRYFVRHSAQLFERALSIREWSSSGRVAYFVPACEVQERFLFPVVPYPCCDGAIRF